MKRLCLLFCAMVVILSACSTQAETEEPPETIPQPPVESTFSIEETAEPSDEAETTVEAMDGEEDWEKDPETVIWNQFDNIASMFMPINGSYAFSFEVNQYTREDIPTYSFDNTTIFKGSEGDAAETMERGKNPGLGVWGLHEQGITGKGVNVAIIDQHMLPGHPEYADRIVAYYDSGCMVPENDGSFHGASVASILGGKTVGVAPEVNIYYAAAPSWLKDSAYNADSLYWVIEQNKALPEDQKIRLVSVSSAPQDGWYTNSELWIEAVKAAQEEGIMVIDCRSIDKSTGFVFSAYYDPEDPDDVQKCQVGYPHEVVDDFTTAYWENTIFAPSSYRTLAQERLSGVYCYWYDGLGGQSWAVPYVAGVLALGWQVRPDLSPEVMKELLFDSAWYNDMDRPIIDPPAFIERVRNYSND